MKMSGHRLLSFMLGIFLFAGVSAAAAQPVGTVNVSIALDGDRRGAVLDVPAGCRKVIVERRASADRKWVRHRAVTVSSSPILVRVKLPRTPARVEWRATGVIPSEAPAERKYPAAFYRGAKSFTPSAATSREASPGLPTDGLLNALAPSDGEATTAVEEPDIWKADGNLVYYFNQLRGLQVIDLADPADPVLAATYRLPAKGRDLYVMNAAAGARFAILLTQEHDPSTYAPRTGVKVVRVEGEVATLVSEMEVEGWLADSRAVGNRVYLTTQRWDLPGGAEQSTLSEVVVDTESGTLSAGASHSVAGSWPVVAAGPGWLAVAASNPNDWQTSKITLFSLGANGATRLTPAPVSAFGRVYDKFKIHFANNTLSVFSVKSVATNEPGFPWRRTPVTMLENFSFNGSPLAALEIIRGEQLFATRFAGEKAYAVTFEQVDPLWVIDISDPQAPAITGHLEVPGWSTHIEPVGDLLFSIGFDGGRVAASLFDVSDPAHPTLSDRVFMDGPWGHTEATYDERALKVLADEGLVLVPYSRGGAEPGERHFVQLLELDTAGRRLHLRGTISHDFQPRRAAFVAGTLASISQRQLITADVSDRDAPVVLAEILLAWPVHRVVEVGNFLLEISDGDSWSGEGPVARIAAADDPEFVFGEIALGEGIVRDAFARDGLLHVLRQTSAERHFIGLPTPLQVLMPTATEPFQTAAMPVDGLPISEFPPPTLYLDTYTLGGLPALELQQTRTLVLPEGYVEVGGLLAASADCFVAVVRQSNFWWGGPVILNDSGLSRMAISSSFMPYHPQSELPAMAAIFPLAEDGVPSAVAITPEQASPVTGAAAGDGLLVFGYGVSRSSERVAGYWTETSRQHFVRILDLRNPASPVLRGPIDLPGSLFEVTDLTREGFLAWSEALADGIRGDGSGRITVSACDGVDAYQIASVEVGSGAAVAASGFNLFAADAGKLRRYALRSTGNIGLEQTLDLGWTPYSLRAVSTGVLGSDWGRLFFAQMAGNELGVVSEWETGLYLDLSNVLLRDGGGLVTPVGEYGVEVLSP